MAVKTVDDMTNDFGFTFVDEQDIVNESPAVATVTAKSEDYQDRLDGIMKLIKPFLKNLQANPTQQYLKWPDRAAKVADFERKLNNIYAGKL